MEIVLTGQHIMNFWLVLSSVIVVGIGVDVTRNVEWSKSYTKGVVIKLILNLLAAFTVKPFFVVLFSIISLLKGFYYNLRLSMQVVYEGTDEDY